MKAFISSLFVYALTACSGTPGDLDSGWIDRDGVLTRDFGSSSTAPATSVREEGLASTGTGAAAAQAQNCVYIDWCHRPSDGKLVCKAYPACRNQCGQGDLLIEECKDDALWVCGTIANGTFECQ